MLNHSCLLELEEKIKNGLVVSLGAGTDMENGVEYFYIQTNSPNEEYDNDGCFELYHDEDISLESLERAEKYLVELSEKYNLPIEWNYLRA